MPDSPLDKSRLESWEVMLLGWASGLQSCLVTMASGWLVASQDCSVGQSALESWPVRIVVLASQDWSLATTTMPRVD